MWQCTNVASQSKCISVLPPPSPISQDNTALELLLALKSSYYLTFLSMKLQSSKI